MRKASLTGWWLLLLLCGVPLFGQIPAFPGAEGAGAQASGGRAGSVYRVTNLNTSGPGSFADAVSRPNRIIVFTVSGTIDLGTGGKSKRALVIAQPNLTIEGQTAPGEGICIRGGSLRIAASNVIVRHLRIRRGSNTLGDMGDAINVKGDLENVILDHVSTSWATDENLTLTVANRVTAQYSIAAEGLDYFNPNQSPNRHSEGSLFGSQTPGGAMTIHHSLYAHNRLRNPRTTGGGSPPPHLDFRNNVIYDWKEFASHTGNEAVELNLVNNYYKPGPSTGVEGGPAAHTIFTFMSPEAHRLYAAGNVLHGDPTRSVDNWQAIGYAHKGKPAEGLRSDSPVLTPAVTTSSALEAFETVLAEAGATLPARDAVDLRIVNDVRHGSGAVINFETDISPAGRWQVYHSLPSPADSDGDGIPDYWQEQFSLPKNSAMQDTDGDGYTNIEEYANNTDPRGGSQPLVYISAGISRAYREGGRPGELLVHRTGPADAALVVRYRIGGAAESLTIAAGHTAAAIPVAPGSGDSVVASVEPGEGYHLGCPRAAMVVIEDGPPPVPVDISKVDAEGGVSEATRQLGEANLKAHKLAKHPK